MTDCWSTPPLPPPSCLGASRLYYIPLLCILQYVALTHPKGPPVETAQPASHGWEGVVAGGEQSSAVVCHAPRGWLSRGGGVSLPMVACT